MRAPAGDRGAVVFTGLAAACAAGSAAACLCGSPAFSLALLAVAAYLTGRALAAGRAGRPRWTDPELSVLDDRESLEQLLRAIPEARKEAKFR